MLADVLYYFLAHGNADIKQRVIIPTMAQDKTSSVRFTAEDQKIVSSLHKRTGIQNTTELLRHALRALERELDYLARRMKK